MRSAACLPRVIHLRFVRLGPLTSRYPVIWIPSGAAALFDASLLTSEPLQSGSFFAYPQVCAEPGVDRPAFGHVVNYGLAGCGRGNDELQVSECVKSSHEQRIAC